MTRYFDAYISSLYDNRYYMLPYFYACLSYWVTKYY